MRESHQFRIEMRKKKFQEQNGICLYCRKPIVGKPSLDHIIPVDLGNGIGEDNFCVACEPCNKNKLNYVVFTNLFDREIYPVISVPYFFRAKYIQTNNSK